MEYFVYYAAYIALGIYILGRVNRLAIERRIIEHQDQEELWSTKLLRKWDTSENQLPIGIVLVLTWPAVFIAMYALAMTESQP